MRALVLLLAVLSAYKADAHEMLPSHPVLSVSYVSGVLKTQMHLFNKRQDVEYYEVGHATRTTLRPPAAARQRPGRAVA